MEYTASEMSQMGRLRSHYPFLHNNREELGELRVGVGGVPS